MTISGIQISKSTLDSIKLNTKEIVGTQDKSQKGQGSSFGEMFVEAIKDVDQMQKHVDKQIEGLIMQKDGVTTHDAMIALEKADIAFQLMNTIRGKIVRAYEEILRTQI